MGPEGRPPPVDGAASDRDAPETGRSAPPDQRSIEQSLSDAQLLDAALDAFAEEGYAGTSVRHLARDMGVNHNHIPQRFGSKDRLWYAAVDHGFRVIRRDLFSMIDEPFPDELTRLRAMVVRFVEINSARPALLRIINQEAVLGGPRLEYLFSTYIEPVYRLGSSILSKLEEQGQVRTDSAGLLYFFMTNGVAGPIVFPGLASRLGVSLDQADADAVHEHAVAAVDLLFDGLRRES